MVFSVVLERRICREVETLIQEEQWSFRLGRGTMDQFYTLGRVLKGAWEFAQTVYMCFVDLEKVFDCVPRGVLWGVLREYGIPNPLIRGLWSLYDQCQSLVRIAGNDDVLLASSSRDPQRSLEQFAAECEVARMKISTSKYETVVLSWQGWYAFSRSGRRSQMREEWRGNSTSGSVQCRHPGTTQFTLERLHLSPGLGTPRDLPGRAG
ncbi:uncharacterized protein LOC133491045 [Syngnathoides biaculeatus]|uniref:uncharacterized protein LOC133491045 n=1 Tax=Syngnathoides biaculeatus TaxID=300417 RepID=UPI002ADE3C5F|nr:uncharacterized protein LOC133491045 [Syngnathoides biaculeatus]